MATKKTALSAGFFVFIKTVRNEACRDGGVGIASTFG